MKLHLVISTKQKKEFLDFPKRLYKNDPNWVCQLDAEIDGIFNPDKNSNFKHGDAKRWLLENEEGKTIGRIAAFYDSKKLDHYQYPTGGCGFFDCIDSQEAANLLFNAAKDWLSQKGIRAMQGPINFGENFNHWGLLVEGFMQQAYALPYNLPYYQKLFEGYGFRNYFEQYAYHKNLSEGFPERMLKFAEYTENRPGYSFEHFSFKRIDDFVDYFVQVYNITWSSFHDNYTPLKREEIYELLKDAKPIIDEELIWFAFDKGKPVGLLVTFPDVNQLLKKLKNGKLNLINKLKLIYYRKRVITRCRAFLSGVIPEYQNTGVIAALFFQIVKVLKSKTNYKELELSWVGDYNPKMISIYDKMGSVKKKKLVTYLYLFESDMKFQRFTNEFEGKLY
jgi:hypothetical protein